MWKLRLDLVGKSSQLFSLCIAVVCNCWTHTNHRLKPTLPKLSICYSCCSFNHAPLLYVIIGTLKCQSLCSRVIRPIAGESACKWEGLHWWLHEWAILHMRTSCQWWYQEQFKLMTLPTARQPSLPGSLEPSRFSALHSGCL